MQGLFYFGLSTASYFMLRRTFSTFSYITHYLRSFFNARKYLKSTVEGGDNQIVASKYYAVVYGSTNRAGIAFAKYLAQKGFNLILIDRNSQTLQD